MSEAGLFVQLLLFALYIDGLQDELPRRVWTGSTTMKTLRYADDTVVTAATVTTTVTYCVLQLNTSIVSTRFRISVFDESCK